MPKKGHSSKNYGQEAAFEYVHFIGLWSYANPYQAALDKNKRSDAEFRVLLKQIIEVNKTRQDSIGEWETTAAKRELAILGG